MDGLTWIDSISSLTIIDLWDKVTSKSFAVQMQEIFSTHIEDN